MKLVLGAGHGLYTSGKRVMKALDSKETREWTLNNGIVTEVINILKQYENVNILRVDDATGKKDITLSDRVKAVNNFKPDLFISVHHDAGINGGTGGGLSVHIAPNASAKTKGYAPKLYKELIDYTGLKGNRATGVQVNNFYVIRKVSCPSILVENGFMDSRTDVPIILSKEFRVNAAKGYVNFLVKEFNLKLKSGVVADDLETLKNGDRGLKVKKLQGNLNGLNFNVGQADGIFGIKTTEQVKEFQKAYNLNVDGIAGKETLDKIYNVIRGFQETLKTFGYELKVNGVIDNETISVVTKFQKDQVIEQTGKADARFFSSINYLVKAAQEVEQETETGNKRITIYKNVAGTFSSKDNAELRKKELDELNVENYILKEELEK